MIFFYILCTCFSLLRGRFGLVSVVLRLLWPDRAARERKILSKTVTTAVYEFLLWECQAWTTEAKTIRVSVPKNFFKAKLLAAVAVSAGNTVRCLRPLPVLFLFSFRLLWPVFRKNSVHTAGREPRRIGKNLNRRVERKKNTFLASMAYVTFYG
jgi:hypothetical protein